MSKCHEWQGARDRHGYGRRRYKGKVWFAHRATWDARRGPIPDGMRVLHTCDNPACVNIEHLFLGSASDNTNDMTVKGRAFWTRKTPLTTDQVAQIRATYVKGQKPTQQDIADTYGITRSMVSMIVNGKARVS